MSEQKKEINIIIEEARKIVENRDTKVSKLNDLLSRKTLLPYAQWNIDKEYTRVCLYENLEFELILLCWKPLAKTPIHNHNKQNCCVFFFDAPFRETIYCNEGQKSLKVNDIQKGGVSSMEKVNACHSLQNLSDKHVMSLHLYNRPIKKCEIIQDSDLESSLNWADLKYDVKLA